MPKAQVIDFSRGRVIDGDTPTTAIMVRVATEAVIHFMNPSSQVSIPVSVLC